MDAIPHVDLKKVAQDLRLKHQQVESVVALLDAENTIPFITRYRKDQTGGLDEEQIRNVQARVTQLRLLLERKQTILRSIESQGKLTPELSAEIDAASTLKLLEDLYLPYKPRKQTLATAARERGLEPLAREILAADPACIDLDARARDFINPDKQVTSAADALLGAGHILAESFSERADLRGRLRSILECTGRLVSSGGEADAEKNSEKKVDPEKKEEKKKDDKGKDDKAKEFRDYFQYSEPLGKIPPHRILAINRGERAKVLRVKIEADADSMLRVVDEQLVPLGHPHAELLRGCAHDALGRLIVPSLERELRREQTDRAESHAVTVFARNLRNLLLQPPIRGRRVLAIDPGFRTGSKLAAIDEFGTLLDHGVAFIVGKAEKLAESRAKVVEMIRQHKLTVVAIGNGTACRETEELVASMIATELADLEVAYVIVNEAGASVYSASNMGREEFPEFDATLRGTISIGRRLQDPLSELVKISPQNIGVGLYQHDLKQKHLQASLDSVVESCVNYVGVDLNTASVALLGYVSGLNQLKARRLVEHRQQHGPFKNREQLREVSGIGESSFTQAAGFLKISDGDNRLDATWIHPESYPAALKVLEKIGTSVDALADKGAVQELSKKISEVSIPALVPELAMGELTLRDILSDLARPGRDPREDLPLPIFKKGILKVEDLHDGMELTGTVLNVVDFGAFVDIGLKDSGLVHISQMANRYIKSPHEVVAVGDVVKVWVLGIEKDRRRVSLSMVDPASKAQAAETRREEGRRDRRPEHARQGGPAGQGQTGQGQSAQGQSGQGGQSGGRPPKPPRPAGEPAPQGGEGGRPATESRPAAQDRRSGNRPPPQRTNVPPRPKPKPRPVGPPISDAMIQGREPMKTFGDLQQLWAKKHQKEDTPPPPEKTGDAAG